MVREVKENIPLHLSQGQSSLRNAVRLMGQHDILRCEDRAKLFEALRRIRSVMDKLENTKEFGEV